MFKVLCAVPVYHAIEPLPAIHLMDLCMEAGRAEAAGKYSVRMLVGGPKLKTQDVRNSGCTFTIGAKMSHLCFIDDDMLVPKELIERLLAHGVDIVAPLFFRSSGKFEPLVFRLDQNGEPEPYLDYPRGVLFKAPGGVGTGVMLIKREVLETLGSPWFYYPERSTRSMDLDFCLRAMAKGFSVCCDSSIVVPQMGVARPVDEMEYRLHRAHA